MKKMPRNLYIGLTLSLLFVSLFSSSASAQAVAAKTNEHLSPLEREVVNELNFARTRPAEYARHLEQLKAHFKGMDYHPPGRNALTTFEGWAAVEEAINFLRAAKPIAPLEVSRGMCSGAGELVKDQNKSGSTGHKGADGSFCEQRVTRFGSWSGGIGENLSYGKYSARERVINLLVDDGVSNRGHRRRIFDPSFKVAGVACGDHPSMGSMCVITLAGGFSDKAPSTKATTLQAPKGVKRM